MRRIAFNPVRFAHPSGCVLAAVLLGFVDVALSQRPTFDCPGGGRLEPAPAAPADAALAGQRAFDLIRMPEFASRHWALVEGEAAWVRDLRGPSAANRFYFPPAGREGGGGTGPILVFDSCKPRDCGDNQLYGAFEMAPGAGVAGIGSGRGYGLRILENRVPRDLGNLSPAGRAAIECAQAQDDELRRRRN